MKQIVYISIPDNNTIEAWLLNEYGVLKFIQKIHTDGQVQPIKIIRNNNILYAGIRPNNRIIMYSINQNGYLKKINETPIPASSNNIEFDVNKNFLLSSSYHFNCITISPLDKNGIVQNHIKTLNNIQGCHASKINKKYNILIVTALKEDCIYLYYFHHDGIITSTEQKLIYTKKNSGPRHISMHPNQDYFYTLNEIDGTIDVWNIYQNQKKIIIKKIQNVHLISKRSQKNFWSADIHITSCGRFLYASDRFSNTIHLFHIKLDNTIIFVQSYLTEKQPRSFCIDYSNKYLIVIGQKSNTFTIYEIFPQTGQLQKIKSYNIAQGALWICRYHLN